jgi:hypothetical protein
MTHSACLLDRFVREDGRLILRGQDNGRILDIQVRPDDADEAADLWGGSWFAYEYRGGRPFFSSQQDDDTYE